MTIQQGLDSLLAELEAVLGTENLAPQRQLYFEGARDYLVTLKRITNPVAEPKKSPKPRPASATSESRIIGERLGKPGSASTP